MPSCLAIGIKEGDFWQMNPAKLRPYLIAENIRREEKNTFAWMQGRYNYEAFSTALANIFSKGKKYNYAEKPYRITPYTETEKAEIAERERQKAISFFNKMQADYEKKKGDD